MHEIVQIALADLLLDPKNPRLRDDGLSTQQTVYRALAHQQGRKLLKLAEDIVRYGGLDPMTLPAVVATPDRQKRYKVVEGNRRVLALKALETPSIIVSEYSAADQKKWTEYAGRFGQDPIELVDCVLFDTEDDARHWIELRHTGLNDGPGLAEWDSNEKDRWLARHGTRQPAGQVIDFVERVTGEPLTNAKILTNVRRLLETKAVLEALGLEVNKGIVHSRFPADETVKGLKRIVDDLSSGAIRVKDIYDAPDRAAYVGRFDKRRELPSPAKRLSAPKPLDELKATTPRKAPATNRTTIRSKAATPKPERTALIPPGSSVNPSPPRINAICNELRSLSLDQYPNAAGVLLRVFLELSVDHEIDKHNLLTPDQRRGATLSKRLKLVAAHLRKAGRIDDSYQKAVNKIADTQAVIAASTATFNQYVHNRYVYPKPSELRTAWDELQPLLQALWP